MKEDLDLPEIEHLCDVMVERDKWPDNLIDIYIDAMVFIEHEQHKIGIDELFRFIYKDLSQKKYTDVYTPKIATVAVQDTKVPGFKKEFADNIFKNKCYGSKMAIRGSLFWKYFECIGNTKDKDKLGRYLYVSHFGVIPKLSFWAFCSWASIYKRIARFFREPDERKKIYDEINDIKSIILNKTRQ